MTDYWVSKLFFDLQHAPKLAAEYRANMPAVIDRYEIKPDGTRSLGQFLHKQPASGMHWDWR